MSSRREVLKGFEPPDLFLQLIDNIHAAAEILLVKPINHNFPSQFPVELPCNLFDRSQRDRNGLTLASIHGFQKRRYFLNEVGNLVILLHNPVANVDVDLEFIFLSPPSIRHGRGALHESEAGLCS
jgi:hypothetical protein